MRKFRNSALAIATATTVALGGMTAASAQDDQQGSLEDLKGTFAELSDSKAQEETTPGEGEEAPAEDASGSLQDIQDSLASLSDDNTDGPSLSSQIGDKVEKDEPFDPRDLFGIETDMEAVPEWAKIFFGVGIAAGIASLIGLVIAPIYNYIHFG